ncbi:hypothetical protein KOM00_08930 [Geomonas sp. Red69]|uniref:DUF5658 domain-containing protein n=1 Tax=Geomonas diazotrophica TaxID=2843197 RepID=A0ABX8JNZ9_9BACT|nr:MULTISPECIES: hypothetical protein [Geomonas]MBU5636857.1 hypothetical protein [Geomonas diazotrophica]QWV98334.1 hypothetical protein KP005_03330 [Geomonas nitrogeniifigens]QXE87518.1 hypothetical protein KP003_03695 [Geomonas nitrogeniifigens]
MDLLTCAFVANIFLTFIDATIGYHAAPALAALVGSDAEEGEVSARGIRRLLSFVVALYMFFNCLAYFDRTTWLLYFTTAVLLVDITAQLVIYRKVTGFRGR